MDINSVFLFNILNIKVLINKYKKIAFNMQLTCSLHTCAIITWFDASGTNKPFATSGKESGWWICTWNVFKLYNKAIYINIYIIYTREEKNIYIF
jgi:hypothetical protein